MVCQHVPSRILLARFQPRGLPVYLLPWAAGMHLAVVCQSARLQASLSIVVC